MGSEGTVAGSLPIELDVLPTAIVLVSIACSRLYRFYAIGKPKGRPLAEFGKKISDRKMTSLF
jgi:hypothetical protein